MGKNIGNLLLFFMKKLKSYSPVRLVFGLLVLVSYLIRKRLNKLKNITNISELKTFYETGFQIIEPQNLCTHKKLCDNIRSIIDTQTNSKDVLCLNDKGLTESFNVNSNAFYLKDKDIPFNFCKDILDMSGIVSKLGMLYKTKFICTNVHIFKTKNVKNLEQGSFKFHRDGHPPYSLKLMVYLNDVNQATGPFAYIPKTRKILIPTYGSYQYDRHDNQQDYNTYSIVGDLGTMFLFDPNGLHAGGRSNKDERNVLTFILQPGKDCALERKENITKTGEREYFIVL